jgi:hypothetical protein
MRSKSIPTAALITFVVGVLFVAALMAASVLPPQDFTAYWAAAHLVRQDPYSAHLVSTFERVSGIGAPNPPLLLRNPPWAIPFILPLGMFSYRVAFAWWTVFSVVVVTGCVAAVWRRIEKPESLFSILFPLIFGPTIVLLMLGQWTVLVLLGITGFLISIERRQDWLAGAFLLLVMGKPHVALLFLLAIGLWIFQTRRWKISYSTALSLAVSSVVVLTLNPHVFTQFLERTREVVDERVPYPNPGGMLYTISGHHMLAILPQIVGVLWLLTYWCRRRLVWDWNTDGMLVLVSSIACSYYSYPYDEVLVLPALVTAFVTGNKRIFLVCFAFINLGYGFYLFQIAGILGFGYMFLWWTGAGWLVTYWLSSNRRFVSRSSQAN